MPTAPVDQGVVVPVWFHSGRFVTHHNSMIDPGGGGVGWGQTRQIQASAIRVAGP